MPKLKDQQDADQQYNPYSNPEVRDLYRQEEEAAEQARYNREFDDIANNFGETADSGTENRNIEAARKAEETPPADGFYRPSGDGQAPKKKFSFKGFAKKRGAAGALIAIILGGLGALIMMISPSMAAVQLKETLTDDLNDQLAAMDTRTGHVFKAKLKDIGGGSCGKIKVKCRYKGFSNRQLKAFEKAGFVVETDGKTRFGKHKVTRLILDTPNGRISVDNPSQLNRLIGERAGRTALRKAFNPKFFGFQDAVSVKRFAKLGIDKRDKITGSTDAERARNLAGAVTGESTALEAAKRNTANEDGSTNEDADEANKVAEEQKNRLESGGNSTGQLYENIAKNGAKSALKGVMITGGVDTLCTVKNTARAVSAAAKNVRAIQLAQYAMVFLTFPDQLKAGEVTPEQAEYVGNILTSVDTEKEIIDEQSTVKDGDTVEKRPNPYYGKNALDAEGPKIALYNEAPTLTARSMQYTVGGTALMGTLSSVNDMIRKKALSDKTCSIVQNNFVRGAMLVIGVGLGAVTFGTSLAFSVGASLALGASLAILESYLGKALAGKAVDEKTKGVDSGNAIFAGSAKMMGDMAMARGMKPASKGDLQEYLAHSAEVKNEYVAYERQLAMATPFDVMNQYSFLGSLTRSLLPLRTASTVSIGNTLTNNFNVLSIGASVFNTNVFAQNSYNEERYSKCDDPTYDDLNIDADVFCNVRYSMSKYERSLDSDAVIDYMLRNNHVDEEGVPTDEYMEWLLVCTERVNGWGEKHEEKENGGLGEICVRDKDEKKLSHFRVYTMDNSIFEAMDYVPPTGSGGITGGSNLRVGSFNVLGASHTDGPKANKPGWPSWRVRIQKSEAVIENNNIDVVAFQEFEPSQRNYLKNNLKSKEGDPYAISTHGKQSDSIMWNTGRFTKTEQGTWQTVYFGGPIQEPWVKLKDNDTQQEFYVMSVHDPINKGRGGPDTRYRNAINHLAQVKRLQTNAPVMLVGDFNSGFNKNKGSGARSYETLAYCVLTKNGAMRNAMNLSLGRAEKCPLNTKKSQDSIDHIYLTPELEVEKGSYTTIKRGASSNGADHATIFADVVIPGGEESEGGGSGGWPVDPSWYKKDRSKFLSAHAGGGAWTGGYSVDINKPGTSGDMDCGEPVYAMYSGKVTRPTLGYGQGVEITADVDGKKLAIAYAHGKRTNNNSSYKAGDKIMSIGKLGNPAYNMSCHLHLDMTYGGKGICPQDIFLALGRGKQPDFNSLAGKGSSCGRL